MGPTLWLISCDDLLISEIPREITLVGFTDDIALGDQKKNEVLLMSLVNRGLQRVWKGIETLNLKLALA